MSSANDKIAVVVLAGGASSRLGSPKQMLQYNGKTLLKHAVDEAMNSNADFVVVVLGANADLFLKEIDGGTASVIENKAWKEGMASSLKTGLKHLLDKWESPDGVIFMVCDQPFLSATVLNDLIRKYRETGKPIVASNYGETIGPPAFFHKSFFTQLMHLTGDEGARKIIQQHPDETATILFPQGSIDIDSKEDYDLLLKP